MGLAPERIQKINDEFDKLLPNGIVCPICGHTKVMLTPEAIAELRVKERLVRTDTELLGSCYSKVCENCGYVMHFSLSVMHVL